MPIDRTTIATVSENSCFSMTQITKTSYGIPAEELASSGHSIREIFAQPRTTLFTPLRLRGVTFKNRIVVAPMYTILDSHRWVHE